MKKNIYWKLTSGLSIFAIAAAFVSCYSLSKDWSSKDTPARLPANYDTASFYSYLKEDPFSKDGYDHNSVRKFEEGTTLSEAQKIKELAGREIWFKSAPNERLHTYIFPQKLNAPINWYKVLRSDRRLKRFDTWGMINDPDCCTPGRDCEAKRITVPVQTYGFDYCPGDDVLATYVGDEKRNYLEADPACNNPILKAADALDEARPRENSCELAFGTSTGAVGFRKFPNPRFNPKQWQKIGGWQGFEKRMSDGSVEPPYRVAIACASCHAAFDPLNPPKNLATPQWSNIKGETGNQYIRISEMLGSGAKVNSVEYQMFTHTRPGVLDTSAVPNDFVNNPGTVNAIINFPARPLFTDQVRRWVNVPQCEGSQCQTIRYKHDSRPKYWELQTKNMSVMHILKGGEDSVGADVAVQRVYVNIGMCAEQCWMNHLTNNRELDPTMRGFGQTPFDIAQCRADCASWRANEDRVGDIVSYLLSRRPTDLKDALVNQSKIKPENPENADKELEQYLDQRYQGEGLVGKGQVIFKQKCAECHSSQNSNKQDLTETTDDFTAKNLFKTKVLESGEIIRADWLGNDKSTSVNKVETFACRALHTNHMQGQVWSEFGSFSNKKRPSVNKNNREKPIDGGRGYYRNISLLNAWAHAPFMHNNAIGPEICGAEDDPEWQLHRSTYQGQQTNPSAKMICDSKFNPSIEGRLRLFEASVDELLTESGRRKPKVTLTDVPIQVPLGVKIGFFGKSKPIVLEIPAGFPVSVLSNFALKDLMQDLRESLVLADNEVEFNNYWIKQAGDEGGKVLAATTRRLLDNLKKAMSLKPDAIKSVVTELKTEREALSKLFMNYYTNCNADVENLGHPFGTDLTPDGKKALKAFLATL